jgi:hypothetical protein
MGGGNGNGKAMTEWEWSGMAAAGALLNECWWRGWKAQAYGKRPNHACWMAAAAAAAAKITSDADGAGWWMRGMRNGRKQWEEEWVGNCASLVLGGLGCWVGPSRKV